MYHTTRSRMLLTAAMGYQTMFKPSEVSLEHTGQRVSTTRGSHETYGRVARPSNEPPGAGAL